MNEQAKVMIRQHDVVDDVSAKSLRYLDRAFAAAEKQGYVPLTDVATLPDGASVLADSKYWIGQFVTDIATPYQPELAVQRRVHLAVGEFPNGSPDVLEHAFTIALRDKGDAGIIALSVRIRETVTCLRIDVHRADVDLRTISDDRRVALISWIADQVLRLRGKHLARNYEYAPYAWVFQYRSLNEGDRFTSAPDENVFSMFSWADRVDGGILDGGVYFIGFKRISPTDGRVITLDPMHWFDGRASEVLRKPPRRGSP